MFLANVEARKTSSLGQVQVISPIQNLYFLISDDDGTTPTENTDVILLFEPDGRSLLYVQSTSDHIVYHGTWSYRNGQLTLEFGSNEVNIHAEFELDLSRKEVEMPFRIFSFEKGSSRWRTQPVIIEHAVRIVFRGEVLKRENPADADTAISRAVDFGNAVIQAWQKDQREAIDAGSNGNFYFLRDKEQGPLDPDLDIADFDPTGLPQQVRPLKNGIEVEYPDGSKIELLLFSWSPPPPGALRLTPKRLVNDPRVHLNVEASGDTSCDPSNKTALFISPFNSTRVIAWFDGVFNRARESGVVPKALSEDFDWDMVMRRLSEQGYSEETLLDNSVTVENLIETFVDLTDPGIVLFYTHGTDQGTLCTGEQLTETDDPLEARQKFEEVKQRLRRAGHGRLVDTQGVGIMSVELGLKVDDDSAWFVTIKPPFWRYIQTLVARPVSFKQSFFFTAACLTDSSDRLRNTIQAKAYFAWNVTVSPQLNEAVFQFLIETLSRNSYSAEEAYYNLVRVVNTRELIRKEDRILSGKVPVSEDAAQSPLFQNLNNYLFNGYGWDGTRMIPYAGNGWLNPQEVDVGQVWWLVFAGRWGQNAKTGADNLKECYKNYWSAGSFGRLKSPFCNAANIGKIPKEADVSYACYLLTGDQPRAYSGQVVPRWTLNESR